LEGPAHDEHHNPYHNILIGDVGGTNVRFKAIRLFHDDVDKVEILKDMTVYNP